MMNEYTQDGSVDLRGNAVLKSKRGGWKAFFFLAGSFSPCLSLSLSLLCILIRVYLFSKQK